MPRIAKSCILQCVKDPNKKIYLPHKKVVFLGRNEETMIIEREMSRKQVAATADYEKYRVEIEVLGRNYSGCNGYALERGGFYPLKHYDRLELRLGLHEFDVVFEPPPDVEDKNAATGSQMKESEQKEPKPTAEDQNANTDTEMEDPEQKKRKPNVDTDTEMEEPEQKKPKPNYPLFNLCEKNVEAAKSNDGSKEDVPVEATTSSELIGSWESIDNGDMVIYSFMDPKPASKIAAFDLDGTIIKTKSGARFPKTSDDWTFNFPEVKDKFPKLLKNDFKIIIFTNQGGLKSDQSKIKEFKNKIENISKKIKVPLQVFVSTGKNIYRKPAPGMWNSLVGEKNDNVEVSINSSLYVGDAAGREKNWAPKKNKDHSVGDRLFALNIGLKFYTPEEYFLGSRSAPFIMPKFDPRNIKSNNTPAELKDTCEVIVMVGSPGSGKSFYYKEFILSKGYAYANRDTLGSWQACLKILEENVQQNQSVVIDNTNPDKASRKRYIDAAKKHNVPCRCFLMKVSSEQCKHNNRFRELTDKCHAPVGDMILNMFKKNFEEPSISEGFEEIVEINFIPKFKNSEHEKLYKMYLLDS